MPSGVYVGLLALSGAALVYIYLGYPVLVSVLARRRKPEVSEKTFVPTVTIILSVRDGVEATRARIENSLDLDYPRNRLEILVGCDASAEAYVAATGFAEQGVRAFEFPRLGKASVHNELIRRASGEIVLTTDVRTRFPRDFVLKILAPFRDPSVGGVTGVLKIRNGALTATARTEARYWTYETWLRQRESDADMLLSVAGACFAFRRSLYRQIGTTSDTDNLVPFLLAEHGYRTVQTLEALAYEEAIETPGRELKNRTRTVTRSFADNLRHPRLLNPFVFPRYFLTIISHKLLRWLTPYFVLGVWLSALGLWEYWIARGIVVGGLVWALGSSAGWLLSRYRRLPSIWSVMVSALVVNVAFLVGTFNVVRGKKIETW